MIIPGMSAGTVIILVGLYGGLLAHLNGFYKSKKNFIDALMFAIPLLLGAVIGLLSLSRALEYLIEHFSLPIFSLFAGFVCGIIPLVLIDAFTDRSKDNPAETKRVPIKWWYAIPFLIAASIVITFAILKAPDSGVKALSFGTGIMLVIAGAIAAADMIIPGISGSFVLVLIGYYSTMLDALNTFNIPVLLMFALGIPFGLVVASKGVGYFLKNFRTGTYMVIVGFLVGSVIAIFIMSDTYNSGVNAVGIATAPILFVIGFVTVLMTSMARKGKSLL